MSAKGETIVNLKWQEVKQSGSGHYKTGTAEPIDLMKAGGMLHDKCASDIMKYAYRNRREANTIGTEKFISDMHKIQHCAEILIAIAMEYQEENARK
jgi:hypothetical protein